MSLYRDRNLPHKQGMVLVMVTLSYWMQLLLPIRYWSQWAISGSGCTVDMQVGNLSRREMGGVCFKLLNFLNV